MDERRRPEDFLELVERARRGRLKVYIGFAAGRRQDLPHARGGARAARSAASTSCSASSRRTAAPRPRRCSRASRSCRAASVEYRGAHRRGDGPRRGARAQAARRARRRDRPHQRARARRNAKRYQDVLELLDAGINVICAFNIQHLESLKDIVERATGVAHPRDRARHLPEAGRPGGEPRPRRRGPARAAARPARSTPPRRWRGRSRTSSRTRTSRRCASWRCARWPRASGARRAGSPGASEPVRRADQPAGDGVHGVVLAARRRRCCAAARAWPAGSTPTGSCVYVETPARGARAHRRRGAAPPAREHRDGARARRRGGAAAGRDPVAALLDFARSHARRPHRDRPLARRLVAQLLGRDFVPRAWSREADDFDLHVVGLARRGAEP